MSKYFSAKELACRCNRGCGYMPSGIFVHVLDAIREEYGKPIYTTSVARCPEHNKAIGGANFSRHVRGRAADLVRTPELLAFLIKNAARFKISIEDPDETPGWIHIDPDARNGQYGVFKLEWK